MHYGKKFAYIVGGKGFELLMKELQTGVHLHALIFHLAGIAAASSVYSHRSGQYLRYGTVVHHIDGCFGNGSDNAHFVLGIAAIGAYGSLARVVSLILGAGIPFHSSLAVLPRLAYSGFASHPHHVPFSSCRHIRVPFLFFGVFNSFSATKLIEK